MPVQIVVHKDLSEGYHVVTSCGVGKSCVWTLFKSFWSSPMIHHTGIKNQYEMLKNNNKKTGGSQIGPVALFHVGMG